jgi:hypothetical protein
MAKLKVLVTGYALTLTFKERVAPEEATVSNLLVRHTIWVVEVDWGTQEV